SRHSAGTIAEDFSDMEEKTIALPGGVNTELFHPAALDPDALKNLTGGSGRGPSEDAELDRAIVRATNAEELAGALRIVSASYDARAHDHDAGKRLTRLLADDAPLVVYVGKLIHSKGVHSLLAAFAHVHRETGARLLIVGFGTFREALETLTRSLNTGDEKIVRLLAEHGPLFEGREASPMEHFTLSEALFRNAAGMKEAVEFIGPLHHAELAKLLPAADAGVVPSIFPETFGLVAAEFAAAGVPPFVADHSGLREAGGIVGHGLHFDLCVGMDGFESNLARVLTDYLSLSGEERQRCREVVRRNSVERLSWETLANGVARIAAGK
ncbi:MAG: glycosyltransferase family 4 protein, partial [Actinomycetota bacterium]|nr:glycosyltransferase family 4 protein [Actinomycetota bacterium]